MKTSWSVLFKLLAVILMLASALLLVVPDGQAKIRTQGVELPAYARIEHGFAIHTAEWAAIAFYRPTECVPGDFNLLDFFDLAAFGCTPSTTGGFAIWSGEPWITAPIQMHFYGLGAVPVWFVSWPELEAAMADEMLTMVELEGLPSLLIGSASFYTETLHPSDPSMVVRSPMIEYQAFGLLEDGRSFQVHAAGVSPNLSTKILGNISISFK